MNAPRGLALGLLALCASACASIGSEEEIPVLASARVTTDFETYELRRVGLLPIDAPGDQLPDPALQASFFAELAGATDFEIVPLDPRDLEEVLTSEPYRRGRYSPHTIVELSRRYNLDGLFFGTITDQKYYPPQRLGLSIDLVAAETGLVIWAGSVHLDARDSTVRQALESWNQREGEPDGAWEVALLSPHMFASFAAWQVASLL